MHLPIIHFNDVYHITQKTLSAANFSGKVKQLRSKYGDDTLLLFSGDVFNPSIESSITRGSHMIPILNELRVDMSCLGNHDFDFGIENLKNLIPQTLCPWLLSNVIDTQTGNPPAGAEKYRILERKGIKIGFIGLVEKEWIATIPNFPSSIIYQPMIDVGIKLADMLRTQERVDIVIALTHSRLPNDINLANSTRGKLDLILGGHDHIYYIGKGCEIVKGWERPSKPQQGTELDQDCKIIKSATDFRALSEILIDFNENKKIEKIRVTKHIIDSNVPPDPEMTTIIDQITSKIGQITNKPICKTLTEWNCLSAHVRLGESAIGNFFTDIMREAYAGSYAGLTADFGFSCGGSIRGDNIYGPGEIILGDLLEILPFEDPVIVLELSGQQIWDALENGLSQFPAQEGRFPIVSGLVVKWNSTKPGGKRLESVKLAKDNTDINFTKKYTVATRQYMAEGYDGYTVLKGAKEIVDEENGIPLSSIIRKYFIGLGFICQQRESYPNIKCSQRTKDAVLRVMKIIKAANAFRSSEHQSTYVNDHSQQGINDALHAHDREEGGIKDVGDRCARVESSNCEKDSHFIPIVKPVIEGRMVNIARLID